MARRRTAVAKQDPNAPLTERPAWAGTDTTRGSEDVSLDDVAIPRIDVIQDLSPQRKKAQPEYIEGADTGMIFNTVTNRLYGEEVDFVPVFFRKEWVIWKDRDAGGGFRGAFGSEDDARAALTRLEDGAQCDIIDTAQHFVLVLGPEGLEEAVISMSRSKMKASRKLNSLCRQVGGDRFCAVYGLRSVEASGPKGDYVNFDVTYKGFCPEDLYRAGEQMYEAVRAGIRDVDRTDRRGSDATTEDDDF